jgi:hypothetical protein
MNEEEQAVFRRMAAGGVLGAVLAAAIGYVFAMYRDNINPVAGLGLVVLSSIGMVAGATIGIFKKRKRRTINEH